MKRLLLSITGACALFWLATLQGAEVPNGLKLSKDQSLTRTLRGDPESLDPHLATGIPEDHVTRELFEGLVTQDIQGNIIPGQAESWKTSADGKTWTFTLRKGLKWSDGSPLTAADFEYSFKRLAAPETASAYGWYLASMGVVNAQEVLEGRKPATELGITATPDNRLTVKLVEPAPQLLSMLTHRSMNPVPRKAIEEFGRSWIQADKMISNGPFTLVKRVIHERLVLEQNSRYWNSRDTIIEKITFLPVESEAAALNRYRTGEIDLLSSIPVSHYKKLASEIPDQLKTTPTLATYYLTFNTREKPFDDLRIRQALSYTINRERITRNVLGQGQTAAYTFTPAIVTGFTAPVPGYQKMTEGKRLAKAKQLLQEAGFNEKRPLEFTYTYNTNDVNKHIAVAIQEMWQSQLPVKVELQSMEWATYLQNKREGKYQVARALWGGDYDDAATMLGIHTPGHSNNSSFYNNPGFNRLLSQAGRTLDREERNSLYAEAELQLAQDMPVAPVYWNNNIYLIKPDLRGVSYQNPEGRIYSREIYRVKQ